jgi:hypothetical protein
MLAQIEKKCGKNPELNGRRRFDVERPTFSSKKMQLNSRAGRKVKELGALPAVVNEAGILVYSPEHSGIFGKRFQLSMINVFRSHQSIDRWC